VFSSKLEEDIFWERLAQYNPKYTPEYFDARYVPVKTLKTYFPDGLAQTTA